MTHLTPIRPLRLDAPAIKTLILLLIITATGLEAQTGWEVFYEENFNDGIAQEWYFDSEWDLAHSSGNYYMCGTGHGWARYHRADTWTDYALQFSCWLTAGATVHINVRRSDQHGRYYVVFKNDGLSFNKESPWSNHLRIDDISCNYASNTEYKIKVVLNKDTIAVYVNDEKTIQYVDPNPLAYGRIAFESLTSSPVYIDNIIVTGPPLPEIVKEHEWIRTGGPIGGLGYDIRIHPQNKNIMYVTDNPSGVNKSVNGGESWSQLNNGIQAFESGDIPIFALTIDPNEPEIVWTGTQDSKGVYKSTDGGNTWQERTNGITEGEEISFRGFAIKPGNSDVVLAAAEISTELHGIEFNKTKGKIYKTVNGGESWYPVWEGDNLARVLIFNPLHPDTIFCSTGIFDREAYNSDKDSGKPGGTGILRSTDGGESWKEINNGIGNLYTGFLEMHPEKPHVLYAASGNNAWIWEPNRFFGGIYKTTNGGESWKDVLGWDVYTVVTISPSDPNVVYAGSVGSFYVSKDGGRTWQRTIENFKQGWGPNGVYAGVPISAVVDPENANVIFVNNYGGGNFKSVNGTKTWTNASNGYTGATIRDISVSTDNDALVYTVTRTGPFTTHNGGQDWNGISFDPVMGAEWYAVAAMPGNANHVLVSSEHTGLLYLSLDGGLAWNHVFKVPGVDDGTVQSRYGFKTIAYAPSNTQTVYAGVSMAGNYNEMNWITTGYGVYKSLNGGRSWQHLGGEISDKNINYIAVDPQDENTVYVCTVLDGIYKSTTGGSSWTVINNGLPNGNVKNIAIDPSDTQLLIAGMGWGVGVAKSTNGGTSWSLANNGIQLVCPSSLSPIGRPALGVNVEVSRFSHSTNSYNVPWTNIVDIAFNPSNPNYVYAADMYTGIYLSMDKGSSWHPVNTDISTRNVSCLDITPDGQTLYAGTRGRGVFRLVLGKNRAPQLMTALPVLQDTVTIALGDSLLFECFAYDLDDDSLSYCWFSDSNYITGASQAFYQYRTASIADGNHTLTVHISDADTTVDFEWHIKVLSSSVVDNNQYRALSFALYQNYPNPFNSSTQIKYKIPSQAEVCLKIFNLMGQEVCVLQDGMKNAGTHQIRWNGLNKNGIAVASGVYIYRLESKYGGKKYMQERKMLLLQ